MSKSFKNTVQTGDISDDQNNITQRRTVQSVDFSKYVLRSEITNIVRPEICTAIKKAISDEFSGIRQEFSEFKESVKFISARYDEAIANLQTCTQEIKLLRNENTTLQKQMKNIESRLSQLEQDARQNNLEIHCLPEHKQENLVKTMMQLSNVVSYPVTENDILSCSRVQKLNPNSKQPKAVICKLSSKSKRDNLLGAVLLYNKSNPKNKLNTKLLGYGGQETPVYVNEHLTLTNKALHAATRIAAKEKKYKFVWVRNGRILVRKDETSPAQLISHVDHLNKLV